MAILLVGLIYKVAGLDRGQHWAVCGVAVTLLVVYWLIFSAPSFPPRAASQKLGYLMAGSLVLSLVFAARPERARNWRHVVFLVVLGGVLWIAESRLGQGQVGAVMLIIAVAVVVLGVLLWMRDRPVESAVAVMVAAFALASVAMLASSASITQMALAIGVAIGGYLLWTWPTPRLAFAETGIIVAAAPLIWIAGQTALYTSANTLSLTAIAATVLAPFIRKALFSGSSLQGDALRPVLTGIIAAVFAVSAIVIAYIGQPADSGYGG